MYTLILWLLIGMGVGLAVWGAASRRWWRIVLGAAVLLGTAMLFGLMTFWGELLWFQSLGQTQRFWTAVLARLLTVAVAAAFSGAIVFLLTLPIPKTPPFARTWPQSVAVAVGGVWGWSNWDTLLKWWYAVPTDLRDPIFGLSTGFYLFGLPLLDSVVGLCIMLALITITAAAVWAYAPRQMERASTHHIEVRFTRRYEDYRPVYFALGIFALALAAAQALAVFHLIYSSHGVVTGPGWTDVYVRVPALIVLAITTAAMGVLLFVRPVTARLHRRLAGEALHGPAPVLRPFAVPAAVVAVVWGLSALVVPALVQWLVVEPNEITKEAPYIEHNIRFTREAFGLDEIEVREFPVSTEFTQQTVEENRDLLGQIRLWDPRALIDVYRQFQEIRLYYEFPDVDIDRYTVDGQYRQMMISPRELEVSNLPARSQTFVNRRFKYTHGYGVTLASVSEFTPEGLPELLIRDIPPKTEHERLEVERPQIYYGERTDGYVVVNTKEQEFDYPSGDENAYLRYPGNGGVPLTNLWRKFLFGWKMGGTRFFFSGYPHAESRIMFRRQVRERVEALAPFLMFGEDPYVVLHEGRLFWIVDAYTTSRHYPYSEPLSAGVTGASKQNAALASGDETVRRLHGSNYVCNSVKAVVDAFHGNVSFYVFEPEDPIVRVWQQIYPNLFQSRDEMPPGLQAHVRYPEGLLLAQGLVYARYHMTDPAVFYNQEDLWVRATEKYYDRVQPVEPYYVMWEPPGSDRLQFIQMLPFTPKNRQVLIGWLAGMCDPGDYGRLLAYRFPKEKRVLGTQQVETKIDQDPQLSSQLTLWNQRGSKVIRGNVLAIPIADTLLYVEPIYLQAESAAYPELRLVAVMHGDRLSYAETFDGALMGLFEEGRPAEPYSPQPAPGGGEIQELAQRAERAFNSYLQLLSERRFQEAADNLQTLQDTLEELTGRPGTAPDQAVTGR